jgi:hypothetical protein
LEEYLLDLLLRKQGVHREYQMLAAEMALLQLAGASSEEATRALEDGGVDHSKAERARRRHRLRRALRNATLYLACFKDEPEKAEAAWVKVIGEMFPLLRLEKTGGTK